MIKKILILTMVLSFLATPVWAKEKEVDLSPQNNYPNNSIMFGFLKSGIGTIFDFSIFQFPYHRAFSDYYGLTFSPAFSRIRANGITLWGGGFQIGPRFLLSGKRVKGWYLFPAFELFLFNTGGVRPVQIVTGNNNLPEVVTLSGMAGFIGAGLKGGYAWVWNNGFSINLGVGGSYRRLFGGLQKLDYNTLYKGFFPVAEFTMGYSW